MHSYHSIEQGTAANLEYPLRYYNGGEGEAGRKALYKPIDGVLWASFSFYTQVVSHSQNTNTQGTIVFIVFLQYGSNKKLGASAGGDHPTYCVPVSLKGCHKSPISWQGQRLDGPNRATSACIQTQWLPTGMTKFLIFQVYHLSYEDLKQEGKGYVIIGPRRLTLCTQYRSWQYYYYCSVLFSDLFNLLRYT